MEHFDLNAGAAADAGSVGDATHNAIVAMFIWWNEAMAADDGLTPEAFAIHYTDEGELIVNGQLRGAGPEALAAHYQRIKAGAKSVRMVLPVLAEAAVGDNAFVHCRTAVLGLDGRAFEEEAMAHAKLENGRIRRLVVVAPS